MAITQAYNTALHGAAMYVPVISLCLAKLLTVELRSLCVSSEFSIPLHYAIHFNLHFAKFEYTINQGVAPTLIYPIPTLESSPVFGRIIHSIRDYYPLWQVCNLSPGCLPLSIRRLACVSKHCISLSLISFHRITFSSNTRNSNTLNYSRVPFNYTFFGISIGIFS
jgi:hypothetical protein